MASTTDSGSVSESSNLSTPTNNNKQKQKQMKSNLLTFIIGAAVVLLVWGIVAATNYSKEGKDKDVIPVTTEFTFENVVSADKEFMSLNYGKGYVWYESTIVLANFLDEENDGEIQSVTDVFEVVTAQEDGGYDTDVVFTTHTKDASSVEARHGFWFGDFVLFEGEIQLTFQEAFQRFNESNYPKPHSQYCVLRKEVGPNVSNPQYIFGNSTYCIYVDAVTGDVSDVSPAYNGTDIEKPVTIWK